MNIPVKNLFLSLGVIIAVAAYSGQAQASGGAAIEEADDAARPGCCVTWGPCAMRSADIALGIADEALQQVLASSILPADSEEDRVKEARVAIGFTSQGIGIARNILGIFERRDDEVAVSEGLEQIATQIGGIIAEIEGDQYEDLDRHLISIFGDFQSMVRAAQAEGDLGSKLGSMSTVAISAAGSISGLVREIKSANQATAAPRAGGRESRRNRSALNRAERAARRAKEAVRRDHGFNRWDHVVRERALRTAGAAALDAAAPAVVEVRDDSGDGSASTVIDLDVDDGGDGA